MTTMAMSSLGGPGCHASAASSMAAAMMDAASPGMCREHRGEVVAQLPSVVVACFEDAVGDGD